jgi:predicted Zn-dependent protease
MKKTSLVMLVLASMAVGASARADTKIHKAAQVSVDVPAGWKFQAPDDNTMVLLDPKEDVLFRLIVIDAGDLEKAMKITDAQVKQVAQDVKWDDKGKPTKLNGMDAMTLEGKGTIKGKPVDLGVLIVQTPSKKVLMVLGLIDHAKMDAHKAEVQGFLGSIKPVAK